MDREEGRRLIEILREGGMAKHPAIETYIDRAHDTGDYEPLAEFLKTFPVVLATAQSKIDDAEHQTAQNSFAPFPTREEAAEHLSGPLKLGYVNQDDSIFGIDYDKLPLLMLILGRVGSGKSNLIKYMLWQALIRPRSFNIIIPDIKREYRHLLPIVKNLVVLPTDKLKINYLQVPSWCHPRDHLYAFAREFVSENYLAGTTENLLIETVDDLYTARGIYDGSINYPTFGDLYDSITAKMAKQGYSRFRDVLLWLQNRLQTYVREPNYNLQFGIPYEVFAKWNLVLEVDTRHTTNNYNYLVAVLINKLYMYNKANNLTGSILRHWINTDEARILFNPNRNTEIVAESIVQELITKSREFGIGFSVLSQESASISQTLRSLLYLKIAFPLSDGKDLDFIKESFGLNDEQRQHLFKLPPYAQAVVRYGGFEKPFLLQVPNFKIKKQVSDQELETRMSQAWAELDRLIKATSIPTTTEVRNKEEELPIHSAALLYHLGRNPFAKVTDLMKANVLSASHLNQALDWLEANGYIKREKYRTAGTKPATHPVLQDKALERLEMPPLPGKGGFEHKLYQHTILQWAEKQGWKAVVEGRVSQQSTKLIDVAVLNSERKKLAYEVTLNNANLLDNIREDFIAGVDEVILVSRNLEEQKRSAAIVTDAPELEIHLDNISFRVISEFSTNPA